MLTTPAQQDLAAMRTQLRALGESERYWEINDLEALWKGLNVKGKPSFWDSSVPLRERAPIVRGHCAQIAASRVVPLVFGEGRFPALTIGGGDADLAGIGLATKDAAGTSDADVLMTAAEFCVKSAKLRLVMRQALEHGLMARTAVGVVSLRAGKLRFDLLPAKECTPTFDLVEDDRLTQLERRYRYPNPTEPTEFLWYRRVITEKEDRTWQDVPCDAKGREPAWDRYPSKAFPLPFCTALWMRNLPEPGACGDVDGVAFFEGAEAEVEAVDRSCSQRHRNALFNGDAQTWITGAGPEDVVGSSGREAAVETFGGGQRFKIWNPSQLSGGSASATQKSPGKNVFLKKADAKVEQIESTGAGAEILSKDIAALSKTLFDKVGVVVVGPSDLGGDTSGETLKKLTAPMLAVCDNLRECWGDALVRAVGMMLRLVADPSNWRDSDGASRVHSLPNAARLRAVLARFSVPMESAPVIDPATLVPVVQVVNVWLDPPFELAWGKYYPESSAERAAEISGAVAGVAGRVITLRTAVQSLASAFDIRDVEGEIGELVGSTGKDKEAVAGMLKGLSPAPIAAPKADVQAAALNGAQVSSLLEVVQLVATGAIPRATGMAIITAAFPIDATQAESLMGTVGTPAFIPTVAASPAPRQGF